MFKLEILIEDSKLVKALKALDGMGGDLHITPVRNAVLEPKAKKVREAGNPQTARGATIAILKVKMAKGEQQIALKDIIAEGLALGSTISAMSQAAPKLALEGIITRIKPGYYTINPDKLAQV